MKNVKSLIGIVCFTIVAASGVQAELIAYEGFIGYTGTSLDQNNGGTGWSGSWHGWNESGDAEYSLNTSSSLPQGASPFTPAGGHAYSTNDPEVCTRILNVALQTTVTTNYYFSFNLRRDAGAGEAGIAFYDSSGSPTLNDLFFGAAYSSSESTEFGLRKANGWARTENAFTNGLNYFIVVKMAMNESGTDDNLYANLYLPGDTVPSSEPGSWQFSNTTSASITPTTLDTIYLRNGVADQEQSLDEFRLGSTWDDVATAIPEANTAMLALIGILSLFLRHKFWHGASSSRG